MQLVNPAQLPKQDTMYIAIEFRIATECYHASESMSSLHQQYYYTDNHTRVCIKSSVAVGSDYI